MRMAWLAAALLSSFEKCTGPTAGSCSFATRSPDPGASCIDCHSGENRRAV